MDTSYTNTASPSSAAATRATLVNLYLHAVSKRRGLTSTQTRSSGRSSSASSFSAPCWRISSFEVRSPCHAHCALLIGFFRSQGAVRLCSFPTTSANSFADTTREQRSRTSGALPSLSPLLIDCYDKSYILVCSIHEPKNEASSSHFKLTLSLSFPHQGMTDEPSRSPRRLLFPYTRRPRPHQPDPLASGSNPTDDWGSTCNS
jgi:hypothetical protein